MVRRGNEIRIGQDMSLRAGATRRQFLTWSAVVGALAFTPQLAGATAGAQSVVTPDYPFRLGVADLAASAEFHGAALAPLGITEIMRVPHTPRRRTSSP